MTTLEMIPQLLMRCGSLGKRVFFYAPVKIHAETYKPLKDSTGKRYIYALPGGACVVGPSKRTKRKDKAVNGVE